MLVDLALLFPLVRYNSPQWRDSPLITKGDPPALPGRQQKFDSSSNHAPRSTDEVLNMSRQAHERNSVDGPARERLNNTRIDPEKNAESALRHTQSELYWGARGRLQAAHLSGPRSVPDAALSGSTLKAPGSAGGYLPA